MLSLLSKQGSRNFCVSFLYFVNWSCPVLCSTMICVVSARFISGLKIFWGTYLLIYWTRTAVNSIIKTMSNTFERSINKVIIIRRENRDDKSVAIIVVHVYSRLHVSRWKISNHHNMFLDFYIFRKNEPLK